MNGTDENKTILQKLGLGFITKTPGLLFSLLVFLLGSTSGIYLDELIRDTNSEFFGPSVEELLEREKFRENFTSIQQKLDSLSSMNSLDDVDVLKEELQTLLSQQQSYIVDLQTLTESQISENSKTKDQMLKGIAPQADFALRTNRAVTLGMRGTIFSTLRIYDKDGGRISVSLNGKSQYMSPGDQVRFSTEEETCTIGYVSGVQDVEITRFNLNCTRLE